MANQNIFLCNSYKLNRKKDKDNVDRVVTRRERALQSQSPLKGLEFTKISPNLYLSFGKYYMGISSGRELK